MSPRDTRLRKSLSYDVFSELSGGPECHVLPTDEQRKTLRKVAEKMPLMAFALCIVEFAERASYYGTTQVFNNFLEFPLPEGASDPVRAEPDP